ncbi:hypothetical protein FOA52_015025 [Chlamydomonas sp. UWO 241]|nr:hypothetical protein FOA52_015025 [Chlamydomonas sp. UWO 241]
MLQLDADAVKADPDLVATVSDAVGAGATAVILSEGAGGATSLYEAAVALRGALRGRASLLLVDRTDVATAAEADGVLLTDQGVPTVVAKRMLSQQALIGRIVSTPEAAAAAAADGSNLVLVSGASGLPANEEVLNQAKASQRSGNPIPVLQYYTSGLTSEAQLMAAWPADLDGLALPVRLLPAAAAAVQVAEGVRHAAGPLPAPQAAEVLLARLQARTAGGAASAADAPTLVDPDGADIGSKSWMNRLLSVNRESLLAEEKAGLARVLAFLEEVTPGMGELQLLRDALARLDDLFLVVVVGEFNSGKSSVINALLGQKYLAEGVLPTTNEISILRHTDDDKAAGKLEQQADGLYVRYLSAPLLKEMNIVDTPGTNVILGRQQRLTEEYVPRADLVLFVMSADRPFSESEVRFLEYIRQWRKKVVFVVNKVDILGSLDEVEEVKRFVSSNAQRLLKLDMPNVITVSSRGALRAKLAVAAMRPDGADPSVSWEDALLTDQPDWEPSGFGALESFVYDFLVGRGGNAGEGVRLKLQTPLYVADALMGACGRALQSDLDAARAELRAVKLVEEQLATFKREMERDAEVQRESLNKVLRDATARLEEFVDKTIQLANTDLLPTYIGGDSKVSVTSTFQAEVAAGPLSNLRVAVAEHGRWLRSNCGSQLDYYVRFVESRGGQGGSEEEAAPSASSSLPSDSDTEGERAVVATSVAALAVVDGFKPSAAAVILDDEIRQAVVGTASFAVGGPVGGLLFASFTPNALEDLLFMAVGGLATYLSVLNLPLRRAEVKQRFGKILANFIGDVQARMEEDLNAQLAEVEAKVRARVSPLEGACSAEVQRLEGLEARRVQLGAELEGLQAKAASLE